MDWITTERLSPEQLYLVVTLVHTRVSISGEQDLYFLQTPQLTLEQDLSLQVGFLIAMVLLFLNALKLTRISTLTFLSFIYFCKIMLSFSFMQYCITSFETSVVVPH